MTKLLEILSSRTEHKILIDCQISLKIFSQIKLFFWFIFLLYYTSILIAYCLLPLCSEITPAVAQGAICVVEEQTELKPRSALCKTSTLTLVLLCSPPFQSPNKKKKVLGGWSYNTVGKAFECRSRPGTN